MQANTQNTYKNPALAYSSYRVSAFESVDRGTQPEIGFGFLEKPRILVVEDEAPLRKLLELSFKTANYTVTSVETGEEALRVLDDKGFDLILLDVMMPGIDGYTVCQEIRRKSQVPIVLLTALSRPDDIIWGLELGADDYITKPFVFKELLVRVEAVLRRFYVYSQNLPSSQIFKCGEIQLDDTSRRVLVRDQEVHLTDTEYRLLYLLVRHAGFPVGKETILREVWSYGGTTTPMDHNLLKVAIRRLRTKIELDPSNPKILVTIRGIGYKINI